MLSLLWPTGTSPGIVILWNVSRQDLFDLYGTSRTLYIVAEDKAAAAEEFTFEEHSGASASYTSKFKHNPGSSGGYWVGIYTYLN